MSNNDSGMSFKRGRMRKEVMKMITVKKILILSSVLLSILLFAPGVLAADSGTADVSGNPALVLGLEVSGSNPFGDMVNGVNVNTTSNTVQTKVTTNAPWSIAVSDASTTGKPNPAALGKMAEWDGAGYTAGGKILTDVFQVSNDGATWLNTDASHGLFTGIAGITYNYPYFQQTIEAADTRVGSGHFYRTVLTFTVSAT